MLPQSVIIHIKVRRCTCRNCGKLILSIVFYKHPYVCKVWCLSSDDGTYPAGIKYVGKCFTSYYRSETDISLGEVPVSSYTGSSLDCIECHPALQSAWYRLRTTASHRYIIRLYLYLFDLRATDFNITDTCKVLFHGTLCPV